MKTELALLAVYNSPKLTLAELAKELGLEERTLQNKIYNGTCPVKVFKLGSKYFAHVSDVAAYIDSQRELPEVAA